MYYKPNDIVRQSTLAAGNGQSEVVSDIYSLVRYCEEMLTKVNA